MHPGGRCEIRRKSGRLLTEGLQVFGSGPRRSARGRPKAVFLLLACCTQEDDAGSEYSFTECSAAPAPACVGYTDTWSFEVPGIITETTTIPASDLFDVSGSTPINYGQLISVAIANPLDSDSPACNADPFEECATVNENFADGVGIDWNFTPVGPLDQLGIYNWYEDGPVLTITEVSDTPEPATVALFGLGLISIISVRCRRGAKNI